MRTIPVAKFTALSFLLFLSVATYSQQFGGNPQSQKWKQINTDTVRVIFPAGLEFSARRSASLVHAMARDTAARLGDRLRKVDIVMQHHTTVSNGYVSLGPFRSEFYMMPTLNNFEFGGQRWADGLVTHEYRHVQQFNNFRNGGSKLMYYLFGEEGLLVATGAAVPDWFFEGDAVYNETRLSRQGRGRLPLFLNQYPALWEAGKNYSWMKLRNGSLRDFVPTHYQLGYLLTTYGYEKYGSDFWRKVTHDASAYRGLFYPWQQAIKRYAGVNYKTFTNEAFQYYKMMRNEQNDERIATQPKPHQGADAGIQTLFPVNKKFVTNYYFPYQAEDDSLIYLRNSYRHLPAFFVKKGNATRKIRVKDIALDEQYSYRDGKIVYAAYKPDIRWGWRNYSEIRILDLNSGMQKKLTHKTKYFTPDISPDGRTVVAVMQNEFGQSALHLLDAGTGELKKAIGADSLYVFTDPKFINNEELIAAVRTPIGQMGLQRIDIGTEKWKWLTAPSWAAIGYPQVYAGHVYFTAGYGGNDDLYALSLENGRIDRLRSDNQGNYFVNRYKDQLVFSRFGAEGYQLIKEGIGISENLPSVQVTGTGARVPDMGGAYRDQQFDFLQNAPMQRFAEKRYKKTTGLFNFHSWRPYYEDPIFTYSLYGENVINTLQSEIYYLYNQNDKTSAVGISESYGGFFPFLNLGTELTFGRNDSVNSMLRTWNQLDSRVGLNVPLNLTGGRTYKFLTLGTNYFLRNEFNTGANKELFGTSSFTYLHHFMSWSQQVQSARQHIFPRFANTLRVDYRYPVSRFEGFQFLANGSLYLPGLLQTHSLVLHGAFQERDTLRGLFSNRLPGSRGYNNYYFSRMWTLGADYHLPLWLPDWGFGNLLYIQRIRGAAFYDLQRVYSNNKLLSADLRSAGAEIYFDTKWWNQYELSFGFRVSHLLDNDFSGLRPAGTTVFEFIVPVVIPK